MPGSVCHSSFTPRGQLPRPYLLLVGPPELVTQNGATLAERPEASPPVGGSGVEGSSGVEGGSGSTKMTQVAPPSHQGSSASLTQISASSRLPHLLANLNASGSAGRQGRRPAWEWCVPAPHREPPLRPPPPPSPGRPEAGWT